MRVALWSLSLLLLLGATGCPSRTRRTLAPQPASRIPEVPDSADGAARARFDEARARFASDAAAAAAAFQAIVRDFPDDPIVPYALLHAGIAAVESRAYDQAVADLTRLSQIPVADPLVHRRGRFYLGLAENYRGQHAQALTYLRASETAVATRSEQIEWLAAMAEATGHSDVPLAAVAHYERWYQVASAAERAYIMARLQVIADAADSAAVRAAYTDLGRRDGPAAVVLGMRVAADWTAAGDAEAARQTRAEIEVARRALGLQAGPGRSRVGNPGRLGAVLPLSGRRARAGDLAMRGLALASGTFRHLDSSAVERFEVSVRDTASASGGARAALDAIAGEGVIAVIGPIDGNSVDAAAAQAHALGLPLVSLNPRSGRRIHPSLPQGSPHVFHIMQSAEDRAAVLARHAYAQGVRRFAVLRPDSGYGRAVDAAFAAEVTNLGAEVVVRSTYPANATSFGNAIGELSGSWEALFIPDQARRLALIAPALAAADLVSQPLDAADPEVGRKILLLSTAEFIAPGYLRSAGRYSMGAVFAPGFYPDRADPVIGGFVDRYERAFGKLPTPLDAYAYDAALVVSQAVAAGARDRDALSNDMAAGAVRGLTGTIGFDNKRRRQDDGLLFAVMRDDSGIAIRALRD